MLNLERYTLLHRPASRELSVFVIVGERLIDERIIAMVCAKVEHPFRIIKRQFGHVMTRYRGLAKNRAQLFTLFALGSLFLVRRRQRWLRKSEQPG